MLQSVRKSCVYMVAAICSYWEALAVAVNMADLAADLASIAICCNIMWL